MKSLLQFSFLALILTAISMTGCEQDKCTRTEQYTEYKPVYKRIDEMRVPATFESPRSLAEPGKIFYYNGYLLINELHKGIHVIDDSDPSSPKPVGFINLPGSIDMAIHNNILYADCYLDLVAIDLTNPKLPVEVNRVPDVFQSFYSYDDQLGYLVEYVPSPATLTIDCSNTNWGREVWLEDNVAFVKVGSSNPGISAGSTISANVIAGGSMARFTVNDDYLYTIDGSDIKVFDVKQSLPALKNSINVQWDIETLFPMAGNLFIGSNSGMLIYDISNPEVPEYRSTFTHAKACDPVIVSGNIAYVTLHDGSECQGFVNQLDVIDVSDINNPSLIKSFPMNNPHGLSIVDKTLYLCEGQSGLKTFDISDNNNIDKNLLDQVTGFFGWDVIVLPSGNQVMVVGSDGIYQFDAKDRSNLSQLSVISIAK